MIWLVMALAGGLGAVARVLTSDKVNARFGAPWGTITVNIVGTFLLVVLLGFGKGDVVFVGGVGALGGFTTFSAWMLDSVRLSAAGGSNAALRHLFGVALVAVALAGAGLWMFGAF